MSVFGCVLRDECVTAEISLPRRCSHGPLKRQHPRSAPVTRLSEGGHRLPRAATPEAFDSSAVPLSPSPPPSPPPPPPTCSLCIHAALQLKLQQRRTREELVSQGIMPRKSTHPHLTAPHLAPPHPFLASPSATALYLASTSIT